jgi:hypothetical protein
VEEERSLGAQLPLLILVSLNLPQIQGEDIYQKDTTILSMSAAVQKISPQINMFYKMRKPTKHELARIRGYIEKAVCNYLLTIQQVKEL